MGWLRLKWIKKKVEVIAIVISAIVILVGSVILKFKDIYPEGVTFFTTEGKGEVINTARIYQSIIEMKAQIEAVRVGIIRVSNGGGIPTPNNVTKRETIYEVYDKGFGIYTISDMREMQQGTRQMISQGLSSNKGCFRSGVSELPDWDGKRLLEETGIETVLLCIITQKKEHLIVVAVMWKGGIILTAAQERIIQDQLIILKQLF